MIKQLIKSAVATSRAWPAVARIRGKKGVRVLMYHRITRYGALFEGTDIDDFVEQMRWLKHHCTIIAPEEFTETLGRPDFRRPPVLVTFDDGYRDYYQNAFPVLEELKIPSLVFLATGFLDDGGLIWTDAIVWAVRRSPRRRVSLPWNNRAEFNLSKEGDQKRCYGQAKEYLKNLRDADRRIWQARLFERLDVDPARTDVGRQMLTWDEVRATMGLTRYGGHTHTHPILSQLEPRQAEEEITRCRSRIREETGRTPRYFAYPNGRAQDFTEDTKVILRRYGFELAFATIEGTHAPGMDLYAIRRQPTGSRSIGDFAWLVAGS